MNKREILQSDNPGDLVRIGLISDTHGFLDHAYTAIDEMGAIDMLIHAGDHYRDAMRIASKMEFPVYAVAGNCDVRFEGPEEEIVRVGGILLFITHGHRYQVKKSVDYLCGRAFDLGAQVVIYGHTHIPGIVKVPVPQNPQGKKLLVMNPGSLSEPREGDRPSYGILEIEDDKLNPQICYLP